MSEDSVVVGKHVYGNLYECDEAVLDDEEYLRKVVVEAAKVANATLVDLKSWKFSGEKGGVSVLALVVESHIAIHTWPRYRYATVDVYTCGARSDPEKAFNYIVEKLRPKYYTKHYVDRSSTSLHASAQYTLLNK
ncbi:MAG: adenosylmethionine decarboxylase [Thermoprotei archaeon]|nr:MAG: adenosylmethionine decarboxylase [Thermoprotei archaeon]